MEQSWFSVRAAERLKRRVGAKRRFSRHQAVHHIPRAAAPANRSPHVGRVTGRLARPTQSPNTMGLLLRSGSGNFEMMGHDPSRPSPGTNIAGCWPATRPGKLDLTYIITARSDPARTTDSLQDIITSVLNTASLAFRSCFSFSPLVFSVAIAGVPLCFLGVASFVPRLCVRLEHVHVPLEPCSSSCVGRIRSQLSGFCLIWLV